MTDAGDAVFAGSIPSQYDTLMVPLIFEGYAARMAEQVSGLAPQAVLETACGTGVVTRALAPILPPGARYVASDLNQPMLDRAASRQPEPERIEWRQADATALPFDDAAFDVVCCQFGVMFFPDRVAGFKEARRVLKPGGHFVFSAWDRIEANQFAHEVTQALAEVFPHDPPAFAARTPHGYHDVSLIRSELQQAGFGQIEIETHERQSHAPTARQAAEAYLLGTPMRLEVEKRDASMLGAAIDRATRVIAARHGEEAVAGTIRAHLVVAS